MEPADPTGVHSEAPPNDKVSHTLVASMAIHCLSPTKTDLPDEIAECIRSIESEQQQIIVHRDCSATDQKSHTRQHIDAESMTRTENKQTSTVPSTSSSRANAGQPQRSTIPGSPMNRSGKGSSHAADERPRHVVRSRSFGSRRTLRPRALDLNALRRERQFSGPFSANPLLPCKRAQSDGDASPDLDTRPKRRESESKDTDSTPLEPKLLEQKPLEPDPRNPGRNIRLPVISQMTSAPFIASGGSISAKFWPPPGTPSPRSTAPGSLPPAASPVALLTPPSSTISKLQLRAGPTATFDSNANGKSMPAQATHVSEMTVSERKARYLQLCSEMWDLTHC